jgi:hypothetical protein
MFSLLLPEPINNNECLRQFEVKITKALTVVYEPVPNQIMEKNIKICLIVMFL